MEDWMMSALDLIFRDGRLTTAEILYHMPDYPLILQAFIWQDYDHYPRFPKLHKFLIFWDHHIEGKIHTVRFCYPGQTTFQTINLSDWMAEIQ